MVGDEKTPSLAQMTAALYWSPLAKDYDINKAEKIVPVGSYEGKSTAPLGDHRFFSSFAGLWKNDKPPTDAQIKRWVRRYGLFSAEDVMSLWRCGKDANGERAGDPLSVEDFVEESHKAHDSLILYEAIINRRGDVARKYIERGERLAYEYPAGPHGTYYRAHVRIGNERHVTPHVIPEKEVPDKVLAHVVPEGPAPDDGLALMVADFAVRQLLTERLDGEHMQLRFGQDFDHKRPLAFPSRPVPLYVPRDLKTAIWHQFAEMMTQFRAWELCGFCRLPYPKRHGRQRYCSDRCRVNAHRERQNQGE